MSEGEFRITQKEAADFLQVSTKSISRYRKRGLRARLCDCVKERALADIRQADHSKFHDKFSFSFLLLFLKEK